MGEPKSVFKPPPPGVPSVPKPQPSSGNQASSSSITERIKAPPPYDVTAPPAYSQGVFKSPLSAKPILMIATQKYGGKALPPNITRPDIPKPITGILPQTVPKAPPPMVPIGPPLPEGQAPPYAVPRQEEQLSVPPKWALGKFNKVHRDQAHKLPPILAPLPMPPPHPVGAAAPRQTTERTSSSTNLPDSLTPTQAASRTDLTTIAIHPGPSSLRLILLPRR